MPAWNTGTSDIHGLEQYATSDKARSYLAIIKKEGSVRKAAETIGITERNLFAMLKRLRKIRDACEAGAQFPGSEYMLPGLQVKGVSAMVENSEGRPTWVKFERDKAEAEAEIAEMRDAFMEELPREKAVKRVSKHVEDDLLALYVLTDYHIGMHAWPEETGDDWNTRIAEDLVYQWFASAIRNAPKAKTAILGQLGDFLHWDGLEAVTPTSRHVLDADTRFQKLVRVAIRVLRRIIRELLKKHETVHVILAEGNHDIASSMWLREIFAAWYEDEPRVTVEQSPDPYYCYEFGKVSLFFHHGHLRKMPNIDDVFVAKFRQTFGRTEYSYGHMGHLHHNKVLETYLMEIEQHATLAAPDSHASRGGWISKRSAKQITYHSKYGEIARYRIPPEML